MGNVSRRESINSEKDGPQHWTLRDATGHRAWIQSWSLRQRHTDICLIDRRWPSPGPACRIQPCLPVLIARAYGQQYQMWWTDPGGQQTLSPAYPGHTGYPEKWFPCSKTCTYGPSTSGAPQPPEECHQAKLSLYLVESPRNPRPLLLRKESHYKSVSIYYNLTSTWIYSKWMLGLIPEIGRECWLHVFCLYSHLVWIHPCVVVVSQFRWEFDSVLHVHLICNLR